MTPAVRTSSSQSKEGKSILLHLADDEYRRLKWIADSMKLSVSAALRSFIPTVRLPDRKVLSGEDGIADASSFDVVPTKKSCDKKEVRRLIEAIQSKNAAVTLAKEVAQQLLDNGEQNLEVETYKRLSRWCHPYRWTEREKQIQPLAHRLSELLFGRVIDRVN